MTQYQNSELLELENRIKALEDNLDRRYTRYQRLLTSSGIASLIAGTGLLAVVYFSDDKSTLTSVTAALAYFNAGISLAYRVGTPKRRTSA